MSFCKDKNNQTDEMQGIKLIKLLLKSTKDAIAYKLQKPKLAKQMHDDFKLNYY